MPKVIIALQEETTRKIYAHLLKEAQIEVISLNSGQRVLETVKNSLPDLIMVDENLADLKGTEVLKALKSQEATRKIPVIIFSYTGREEEKIAAMNLEAKDFIVGMFTSPQEVVAKIKIHLGFQKVYNILPSKESSSIVLEMKKDMGGSPSLQCPKCGSQMMLSLMRDLTRGEDYFKASFFCKECGYTE
jgi:DNA-binding response OmpR family regulator